MSWDLVRGCRPSASRAAGAARCADTLPPLLPPPTGRGRPQPPPRLRRKRCAAFALRRVAPRGVGFGAARYRGLGGRPHPRGPRGGFSAASAVKRKSRPAGALSPAVTVAAAGPSSRCLSFFFVRSCCSSVCALPLRGSRPAAYRCTLFVEVIAKCLFRCCSMAAAYLLLNSHFQSCKSHSQSCKVSSFFGAAFVGCSSVVPPQRARVRMLVSTWPLCG